MSAMAKKIRTVADANGMFLAEHEKRRGELAKGRAHKPVGSDEAVIRSASDRDRRKFIPYRLN
jgi:hypothetical protein